MHNCAVEPQRGYILKLKHQRERQRTMSNSANLIVVNSSSDGRQSCRKGQRVSIKQTGTLGIVCKQLGTQTCLLYKVTVCQGLLK